MEILCFCAGMVFFYTTSCYPLLLIAIALFFKARWQIVIWFLAAIFFAYWHQWVITDSRMPDAIILPNAILTGTISSIPTHTSSKVQFQFSLQSLNHQPVSATVLLACYTHCPLFKTGQTWQLHAKLKKPENLGNPGHFNYKALLQSRHIVWTGYIKNGHSILLQNPPHPNSLLLVRERLAAMIEANITDKKAAAIVQALALGMTNQIGFSEWDLFRHTGTTHLMVISGAHIGLIAGLMYGLFCRLWSLSSRLCLYRPAMQVACIAGFISALGYGLLAGFAVPAQRASIAVFLMLLRYLYSRRFTGWQCWRYALFVVIVWEPHAVLLPGFYLSFLAVAVLMASSRRFYCRGIKKIIGLQLACLVGLMPLTLYWFDYGSVNGLIANMIAIPLVGYVIVPLSLLVLVLLPLMNISSLIACLTGLIKGLLVYLSWVNQISLVNIEYSLADFSIMLSLVAGLSTLCFLPIRALIPVSFVLIIAAWFPKSLTIASGEARIDVLDVGQGLAIVINTAKHSLIYDTGAAFYQGGDMAKMAIIPYLANIGIKTIDKLVISHPDLDHRGGLNSLEGRYAIGELVVDNVAFYHRGSNCHQYPAWDWDGVSFRFLPIKASFRDKNNSSCVLQIATKTQTMLLTGDIEALAEHYLMHTYGHLLASDFLVVAHHGSKTSSTPAFIEYVLPRFAIISAGFDNRYHFPHQQTLNTLQQKGSEILSTIDCGMVTVNLRSVKTIERPGCYKQVPPHY